MSLLTAELPQTITVAGRQLPVNTDFRASIKFEVMMCDPNIEDEKKGLEMLRLYLSETDTAEQQYVALYADQTINALLAFYQGGMPARITSGGASGERSGRVYAYEYDGAYIYASFQQAYGLDLTAENLHWWKFKALFYSLPETTIIKQIMGYRVRKISSKMSPEEKTHLKRMKKMYALPKAVSAEEHARAEQLVAVLMGDGDLSKIVD